MAQQQALQQQMNVVKTVTTTASSSMTATKTQTSHSSMSYKTSSSKTVMSSGAPGSGLDIEGEMARMRSKLDAQMDIMKLQAMQLLPLSSSGVGPNRDLIKLDHQSIQQYVDQQTKDKVRFNFDVREFQSESVVVKSDGNKVEVHAKKTVKHGDEEKTEEYQRTYEMPCEVDVKALTTSLNKDAHMFTVELPVMQINQG